MSDSQTAAEWYYVGHYGQLGPLTLTQIRELAADGVITGETYIWRQGMADWSQASTVPELRSDLGIAAPGTTPPPYSPPPMPTAPRSITPMAPDYGQTHTLHSQAGWQYIQAHAPKSDKSRVAAGVLNIVVPGAGRLYLGYLAHGILQLFVSIITCGIAWIWPLIDGIVILSGGVKLDGYGRRLED